MTWNTPIKTIISWAGLLLSVSLLAGGFPLAAKAASSRGDQFVTATSGNTLTGIDIHGVRFYLYFLPGGYATYRAANGDAEGGRWHLSPDGSVCVAWHNVVQSLSSGCYRVTFKGSKVSWASHARTIELALRGYVSDADLNRSRRQSSHERR